MAKSVWYTLFPCCMDTRAGPRKYTVRGRSQQYLNREKIKIAKQQSQRNFAIKEVSRTYEAPDDKEKEQKIEQPIAQLLAVNRFKSLKNRRISRQESEADQTATENRDSDLTSVPESEATGTYTSNGSEGTPYKYD